MNWSVATEGSRVGKSDLLVVGIAQAKEKPDLKPWRDLDRDLGGALKAHADGKIFSAKAKQTQMLSAGGRRVLLLGLGDPDKLDLNGLRFAASAAGKEARRIEAPAVHLRLPWTALGDFMPEAVARGVVEGAEMGLFDAGALKSLTSKRGPLLPKRWRLSPPEGGGAAVRRGLAEGRDYAAGCLFARELTDRPANLLDPAKLASEARVLARREGMRCSIHGKDWLKAKRMGGVLGVGQGSRTAPRLIELRYSPARVSRNAVGVTLVGKGVTFDSGGISLKPASKMHEMKGDMGGASAVLGAALIIARRKVPVRLRVLVPAVENMPDANAIRPGDVLKMASGKTVEVLNTDAEGRLILADALHLGSREKPDYLIDAATLTGACCIALGDDFAGMFGNHKPLSEAIYAAGGDTFERVWHMPLIDEHHKAIESKIADITNLGGKDAGASTAAAFLEEFVPDEQAWAHLDIAGPAWAEKANLPGDKGATGYGARLLARTVEILAERG